MSQDQAIIITHVGRLANKMFQLMLATELRRRSGRDIPILGYDMPEWGLSVPGRKVPASSRIIDIHGHKFDLDGIALALRQGLVDFVHIRGWGMRLEYYPDPTVYAQMFQAPGAEFYRPADDEILLHVRGEDTLRGRHPRYFPMPVAYYEHVIAQSGMRPVFIGQIHEGPYGEMLRQAFPDATFLPEAPVVSDFQTIRHARHVALSVSTFCWMAAWLSETVTTVHMPVCGLFRPTRQTPMLVPANDPRYRFYSVPFPEMEAREGLALGPWLKEPHEIAAMDRNAVSALVVRGIFGDAA